MKDNTNLLKRVLIFCAVITLLNVVLIGVSVLTKRVSEPVTPPESSVVTDVASVG